MVYKKRNAILFLCFFFFVIAAKSQDLKEHQWKNRIVLVFGEHKNNTLFKKQLSILNKQKKGLKERKLLVYQVFPKSFIFEFNSKKIPSKNIYKEYNLEKSNFKIVLIGLDGERKLTKSKIVTTKKLFSLIDGMPMRKAEIRN